MDVGLANLYEQKTRKLEEQKQASDEMNAILTRDGGLNENSRLAQKNLVAAISVSKTSAWVRKPAAASTTATTITNPAANATTASTTASIAGSADDAAATWLHFWSYYW